MHTSKSLTKSLPLISAYLALSDLSSIARISYSVQMHELVNAFGSRLFWGFFVFLTSQN